MFLFYDKSAGHLPENRLSSLYALYRAAAHMLGQIVCSRNAEHFARQFHQCIQWDHSLRKHSVDGDEPTDVGKLAGIVRVRESTRVPGLFSWDESSSVLKKSPHGKAVGYKHLRVHPQLIERYYYREPPTLMLNDGDEDLTTDNKSAAVQMFVDRYITDYGGKLVCLAENRSSSLWAFFQWACQHDKDLAKLTGKQGNQGLWENTPKKFHQSLKQLLKSENIKYSAAKDRGECKVYCYIQCPRKKGELSLEHCDSARAGWLGLRVSNQLKKAAQQCLDKKKD